MEFRVHVDQSLHERTGLPERSEEQVRAVLDAFERRITTIQVQLDDETHGHLGSPGIRCMIEVHPTGHTPVVVVHHAPSTDEAVKGAARRMRELLVTTFGRMDRRHPGAESIRGRSA